jgi:excisionase family DNA binding protein
LLCCEEIALMLGCTTRTVSRYCAEGRMPRPQRIGRGLVRWPRHVIDAWLAQELG